MKRSGSKGKSLESHSAASMDACDKHQKKERSNNQKHTMDKGSVTCLLFVSPRPQPTGRTKTKTTGRTTHGAVLALAHAWAGRYKRQRPSVRSIHETPINRNQPQFIAIRTRPTAPAGTVHPAAPTHERSERAKARSARTNKAGRVRRWRRLARPTPSGRPQPLIRPSSGTQSIQAGPIDH